MLCTFLDLLYGGFKLWSSEPWVSMATFKIGLRKLTLKKKKKAKELSKALNSRVHVQEEKGGQED